LLSVIAMTGEQEEFRIAIRDEDGIVEARSRARALAKRLGFGLVDQSRIATAVSELARNVVRYATDGHGEAIVRVLSHADAATGIEIVVQDRGPGILDINQAMGDGFTTGKGLGLGLPGARRLMDEFDITSVPGASTTVVVRKWLR
jgi:serine/threonine-protein kinase RsbT